MSAIFISHSSADQKAAEEMKAWLEAQGHTSIFLDFDPEAGIKAGGDWEQTLYQKLRQCQAVVALLTPRWLSSKWCFAELVQAREKGKAIFPVKVEPCDSSGVFTDIQQLDFTTNREEGYERLAIGLKTRGLDPRDVFDWDPNRPPYPGLLAFQEEDAAIFFGRNEEIFRGLETLEGLRRHGRNAPRFVLFLGASGSGKSSLLRAGLIPRLKKDPDNWFSVRPFRPQDNPLEELALALAGAFEALGEPRDWHELYTELNEAAGKTPPDGAALLTIVRELLITARHPDATVLLSLDQAEELFGVSSADAADRFLRLLRAGLEKADRQLMGLATMRSDFLNEFQVRVALHDPAYTQKLGYEAVPVEPMPLRSFPEIIAGPARLAGLEIQEGLVEAMVTDTGSRDALPLLAFTLRRLFERYAADGLLEIREYEELGGLEGAIRTAADQVIKAGNPSDEDLAALRAAFVPAMVRINADGAYTRRRAYLEELPPRASPLLTRFVDARLLVTDRDKDGRETVEVAHEALLRTWPQLRSWLDEDHDKLRLHENLRRAAEEWDAAGRTVEFLLHRGARLEDAEKLALEPRFKLDPISGDYLKACVTLREEEREAERQQELAKRRRIRLTIIGLTLGLMVAATLGGLAFIAQRRAEEQEQKAQQERRVAVSRELSANATSQLPVDPELSLLLATEAVKVADTAEARDALRQGLLESHLRRVLKDPGPVTQAAFSPSGRLIVTASREKDEARVWEAGTGSIQAVLKGHKGGIDSAAFSPDSKLIATGSVDKTARIWDASTGEGEATLAGHEGEVYGVAFSPDGKRVVTASKDETARVWDAKTGAPLLKLIGHSNWVTGAVFSPDGDRVVTASQDGTALVWDAETGKRLAELRHDEPVIDAEYSPNGDWIVTASQDGTVRLWKASTGEQTKELLRHRDVVYTATFSPDSRFVVTASREGTARVLAVATGEAVADLRHTAPVLSASFSPDSKFIVTASQDIAKVWELKTRRIVAELRGHRGALYGAEFSPDGDSIVTASEDGTARVWDSQRVRSIAELKGHTGALTEATFSPDRNLIVTASEDKTAKVWDATGRFIASLEGHNGWVTSAVFSPGSKKVLTGCTDGAWRLWELVGKKQVATQDGVGWIQRVAFSPDGKSFVTASTEKGARLWDTATGRSGARLDDHTDTVNSVEFSPDGKLIVTASRDKTAAVWELATRRKTAEMKGHTGAVNSAAFSSDGKLIVTASQDNTARVWEATTGKVLTVLRGHAGGVTRAAFSPNGRFIVTAGWDNTVLVWETSTGKPVQEIHGHTKGVVSAAFSPNGKFILTASRDQTARIYACEVCTSIEDLLVLARERVTRKLTLQERRKYLYEMEKK